MKTLGFDQRSRLPSTRPVSVIGQQIELLALPSSWSQKRWMLTSECSATLWRETLVCLPAKTAWKRRGESSIRCCRQTLGLRIAARHMGPSEVERVTPTGGWHNPTLTD